MDVQNLRILARVAATRNITTVALEFQLSPGTISKKLQALESEVGAKLFSRTTRSISITPEGEIYLEKSLKVIAAADEVFAAVQDSGGQVRGRLKVTAPRYIGGMDLADCIASFIDEYPDIEMHVDLSSRYVNLQEEGFDLAIRTGELSDSALMARRLIDDPQVIVASPKYLKEFGTPRRPQDLLVHTCLILGDQCRWKFKRKSVSHVARVSGRVRCEDDALLLRCALNGGGIMRTSRAMVEEALAAGHLIELLKEYDASPDPAVRAVFPDTKHVPPRLRAFIDFVGVWLKGDEPSKAPAATDAQPSKKPKRPPVRNSRQDADRAQPVETHTTRDPSGGSHPA